MNPSRIDWSTDSVSMTVLAVVTALMISSCSGSDSTTNKDMDVSRYLPMSVGNEWVYRFESDDEPTTQRVSITGTERYQGQTWYVQISSIGDRAGTDTMLIRLDGTRLWTYRPADGSTLLLCDFGRNAPLDNDDGVSYVDDRSRQVTLSGHTFTSCIRTRSSLPDAPVNTYAPDVGLIESHWFRGRKELVRATVSGDEILK